jgi:hypothetical protein
MLAHTHTPAAAVQENLVPATCKAPGSYDEVVYCTSCGTELSRETKTIAQLDHTPAKAVYENIVPATCTSKGSYEAVVYCSECHTELSRTPKTLAMKAHTLSYVAQVDATAAKDGVKAHYECSVCHKLFSDAEGKNEVTAASLVIPATGVSKGILGDANGDGEVEIDDATFIQRILLDLIVPDDGMILRGNVDGSDEGLDIIDATFIQRHLLGAPVPYSIGEEIK